MYPLAIDIGKPQENPGIIVEPINDPVPRELPVKRPKPAKEPVPA